MAKAKRVFEIAKELGVPSKAIVTKCTAEGVPGITNHMSTVKLGLIQTIHEWFSEDGGGTAVETTKKVDLTKVRTTKAKAKARKKVDAGVVAISVNAKAKPKAKAKARPKAVAKTNDELSVSAETAVIEKIPAAKADGQTAPTDLAPQPVEQENALSVEAPDITDSEIQTEQPAGDIEQAGIAAELDQTEPTGPVGAVNVPRRPTQVAPVGEALQKPKGVQLKGPKVIRIEKADEIKTPRKRKPNGQQGQGPGRPRSNNNVPDMDMPVPGTIPGVTRSRGPVRGRGAGGGAAPETDGRTQQGRRRSMNTRRGRSATGLPTGPTKFSDADLAELDARLNRATGFVKQRKRNMNKSGGGAQAQSPVLVGGKVEIAEPITIKSLSATTGIKGADIIKYLFTKGVMSTINSAIDSEMAMEVALEYNIELEVKEKQTAEQALIEDFSKREIIDQQPRPPIVTVLGHVDHGKTSLLDRIRKADVADHEAGGITQHVGAYRVTIEGSDGKDKTVVFLDTPGHEAFTSMRARGASMTDIVVLMVAADDGVMPQTIESINHAKAAGVPVVVALNKIDVPQATEENIHRIYGQLAEHELNPTEWGGDTEVIKTSATEGTGITDLLEVLDYQADLLELKADFGGRAMGTVIEAEMQPGRGRVARLLVQEGQMKVGDFVVMGRGFGRVRDLADDRGKSVRQAGPATPVELSGIDELPDAGDKFYVTDTLQKAEDAAMQFREDERNIQLARQTKVTLDNFADQIAAGDVRDLRVVLKADVQGSIDVLRKTLGEIGNAEVKVNVLHAAVGAVTESDVLLADASDAIIIGFHVTSPTYVRELADAKRIDVRLYRVIYDVIDDVKKGLEGMLEPEKKEEPIGEAEVREVFRVSKLGNIAGCLVTEGVMKRGVKVRLIRDGAVVTEGRAIETLRRVKDEAKEVRAGTECGIRIEGFDDVKPDDKIVCYNVLTIARKLES